MSQLERSKTQMKRRISQNNRKRKQRHARTDYPLTIIDHKRKKTKQSCYKHKDCYFVFPKECDKNRPERERESKQKKSFRLIGLAERQREGEREREREREKVTKYETEVIFLFDRKIS